MLKQIKANKRKVWRDTYGKPAMVRAAIKFSIVRQTLASSEMTAMMIAATGALNSSLLSVSKSMALAEDHVINTLSFINETSRKAK